MPLLSRGRACRAAGSLSRRAALRHAARRPRHLGGEVGVARRDEEDAHHELLDALVVARRVIVAQRCARERRA